ncbi:MAG TPA: hypothetical protein VFH92_14260 [Phenylobacterium sp.]|nr:hypothetical protein [Phenylobacterium sp.]
MSVKLLARLLAILAVLALPLVATAAPARASSCDPCPPDCPMMAQASSTAGGAHAGAPADAPHSKHAPCTPDAICLSAGAALAPSLVEAPAQFLAQTIRLSPLAQLPAASHPPDRSLRPPIQL